MKNKVYCIFMTLIYSFSICAKNSPDILVYTKTNAPWNIFLLDEIQQTMINFGKDINIRRFQYKGSELTYDNSSLEDMLTEGTTSFLSKLEDMSGLGILEIRPEFSIQSLGYDLLNVSPEIDVQSVEDGVEVKANLSLNGLDIFADSFDINFVFPQMVSKKKVKVTALTISIKNPVVKFSQGVTLPFKLGLIIKKIKEGVKVNYTKLDLKELAETLKNSVHAFDFTFSGLDISDVSLEIMGQTIYVNESKIKEIINEHKDDLKKIIIEQLAAIVERDGFLSLVKKYDGEEVNTKFWFNTKNDKKYPLVLDLESIGTINDDVLALGINGDFCSKDVFDSFSFECINNKKLKNYPNTITKEMNLKSLKNLSNKMKSGSQFIASVNENYFTKLIYGTVANGEWDNLLSEFDIKLGKKKAIVRFNESGDTAKVYIDVIYRVSPIQGLMLSRRNIKFPIVLNVKPSVKYIEVDHQKGVDGEVEKKILPHVVFTVKDVALEDSILRFGVPEYGFKSNIHKLTYGLRWAVIKKIQLELFDFDAGFNSYTTNKWEGVELPPLLFPELSNLYLEKLDFQSDGNGRANFIINDDDFLLRELD